MADFNKNFAEEYLDESKHWYYKNSDTKTSSTLVLATSKILQLLDVIDSPKKVVSVGVGSGEEVCAASALFCPLGATVYGLDLSQEALDLAQAKLDALALKAELILANAMQMPFEKNSVSIFIESSLVHEIYSYSEDGEEAWRKNITEISDKLSENGVFLLRDFAAPLHNEEILLTCISDISKSFYLYFKRNYRVFETWDKNKVQKILFRRELNDSYFPPLDKNTGSVGLPSWKAVELMLHFKIFFRKHLQGLLTFNDPAWKEINEVYLPFFGVSEGGKPMSRDEYVPEVLRVSSITLKDTPYDIVCIQNKTSNVQEDAQFFKTHFTLHKKDETEDVDLYSSITEKMELIFKKIKR